MNNQNIKMLEKLRAALGVKDDEFDDEKLLLVTAGSITSAVCELQIAIENLHHVTVGAIKEDKQKLLSILGTITRNEPHVVVRWITPKKESAEDYPVDVQELVVSPNTIVLNVNNKMTYALFKHQLVLLVGWLISNKSIKPESLVDSFLIGADPDDLVYPEMVGEHIAIIEVVGV